MNLSTRHGFTLIELMIVVLILGIIVAIAFPAYTNQVQKTRRADATTALLGAAQQLERCFTRTNSYLGCLDLDPDGIISENGHYDIEIPELTGTTYTLKATAKTTSQKNDSCDGFTLTHTGQRDVDKGSKEECWRT